MVYIRWLGRYVAYMASYVYTAFITAKMKEATDDTSSWSAFVCNLNIFIA